MYICLEIIPCNSSRVTWGLAENRIAWNRFCKYWSLEFISTAKSICSCHLVVIYSKLQIFLQNSGSLSTIGLNRLQIPLSSTAFSFSWQLQELTTVDSPRLLWLLNLWEIMIFLSLSQCVMSESQKSALTTVSYLVVRLYYLQHRCILSSSMSAP